MFKNKLLRTLRIAKGFTYNEFLSGLDKLGLKITKPTIYAWERGESEPRISDVYILAKFFGISIRKFIA